MKCLVTYLSIFTSIICSAQNILEYNTFYRGENIYIQNPFKGSGTGFCVDKVLINNHEVKDQINSSAFMVNLRNLNFQLDDSINIKIFHGNNCLPKMLNTNWGSCPPTVEFINISFDSEGILKWKTKNEMKLQNFIIEQYRWNKWIRAGEID